jgi:sulfur-oxidizing protein SoxX
MRFLHRRELISGRDGNCLLCHAVAETGVRFMGDIAPPLSGVGARLSEGQLRLRIVDSSRLNPETVMPSYYKVDGLVRVAPAWRGKPVLTAQQIEDVIVYLKTLK